jgi:hypothetical protein
MALNEPGVFDGNVINLQLAKCFHLETYCLSGWYDPSMSWMPPEEAEKMWEHEVGGRAGLHHVPYMNGMSEAESEDFSVPPGHDRRRKIPPHRRFESLPLITGSCGNYFLVPYRVSTPRKVLEYREVEAVFDLRLPIDYQLQNLRAYLIEHQKALAAGGFVGALPDLSDAKRSYGEYLRLLDQRDEGMSFMEIAINSGVLKQVSSVRTYDERSKQMIKKPRYTDSKRPTATDGALTDPWRKKYERAVQLRDHGYLGLAFMA